MKHVGSILFSLCLLFLVGCADEIGPFNPGDPAPDPIFTFNGVIDGDSVQMVAGDNGYRMSTNKLQDTLAPNGTIFRGEMHDPDCPGCEPELHVNLFHRPQTPAGSIADSTFAAGFVVTNPPAPVLPNTRTLEFNYQGQVGPGGPQVFWDFGDGTAGQGLSVQHTYDLSNPLDSAFPVSCSTIGNVLCTYFNPVNPFANFIFEVDITVNGSGGTFNTVDVDISPILGNQGNLLVDMGDGTIVAQDWSFNHTYSQPGLYSIFVLYTATDPANAFVYFRDVHIGPQGPCSGGFNYREIPNPLPPGPPTREVTITYDAPNGDRYTSAPLFGGTEQSVEITNHTPYKDNEHGDLVYIVDLEFDGWLYRLGGQDSIRVENGVFQWGLPH